MATKKNVTQISAIKRISKALTIYSASVPFAFAAQAFRFDSTLPPSERAQRTLDPRHARKIQQYLENTEHYYLPPLIVAVKGEVEFIPFKKDSDNGTLVIGMNALYSILDGQHRTAGIRGLLEKESTRETFKDEHISVDFLMDVELDQAQTFFRLLNDAGKSVSKNLTLLYADDSVSKEIHQILASVPLFDEQFVEKEKTNLNIKNDKMFVYKWIFNATKTMKPGISPDYDREYHRSFWLTLTDTIPQWNQVLAGTITPQQVREGYICSAGIFIEALGEVGKFFAESCQDKPGKIKEYLTPLKNVDWSKNNPVWRNHVVDSNQKLLSRRGAKNFLIEYLLGQINANTESELAA